MIAAAGSAPRKIGFIGFGEAARAWCESLAATNSALTFAAYDLLLDDREQADAMCDAMRTRDVRIARSAAELADADWVFSAVTADQSLIALQTFAPHARQGQIVFDINSVSPGRKRESSALIEGRSAAYVDMAVMAPVHPRKHRTPVLIAGSFDADLRDALTALDFSYDVAGEAAGAATAVKMVRSLFVKGLEAITVEALLAAEASGCFETVYASLEKSYPGLGWPDYARYQFERTLTHGKRRAAEMRESAATVSELGLHGALAAEIAAVHDNMGAAGPDQAESDLREAVRRALAARRND